MDNFREGMMRLGAGNWSQEQCVEKVEEMLRRAIIHQEDLWGMLMLHSSDQDHQLGPSSSTMMQMRDRLPGVSGENVNCDQVCIIPPIVFRALKAKLENSMDWSHLALCRLKEILSQTASAPPCVDPAMTAPAATLVIDSSAAGIRQLAMRFRGQYEDLPIKPESRMTQSSSAVKQAPAPGISSSSSKLKLHTPLSPLHVPLIQENLSSSPHPFTAGQQLFSCFSAGRSGPSTVAESPLSSYLFAGIDHMNIPNSAAAPTATAAGDQSVLTSESLNLQAGDVVPMPQQLLMDSTDPWPAVHASGELFLSGNFADPVLTREHHLQSGQSCMTSSTTCRSLDAAPHDAAIRSYDQLSGAAAAGAEAFKLAATRGKTENSEQSVPEASAASYIERASLKTGNPIRPAKRERDQQASAEVEHKYSEVQYQRLGDEGKKGIPDDGHRGWKKYGNKTIQNANFCRGYYKCSVKECNAKKTVQPTDEDPSLFEVTYVGEHTCSSSSNAGSAAHRRKRLQRMSIKAVTTAAGAVVATENNDSRVFSSAVNTSTTAPPTTTNAGTTAAAETSWSRDQWQIIPTTGRSSQQQQVFTTAVTTTTITQGGSSDVEEELETSIEGRGSTDSTSTSCTAGSDDDDDWARNLEAAAAAADEDGGDQTDDIDSYLNGSSADGSGYALISGYLQNDDGLNNSKHLSDSSESLWTDLMQSSENLTAQISNLLTIELQS
ncbi:unnamed protein product [Sphagnum jensenii]|uniref:Uncharacterized protein n=2 Tax=Sphagnum jensenii TaxID=128206 RepID=A0ABP0VYY4_9BRYO